MFDVMIDIETLDTAPTASILSVAAVRFNPGGPTGNIGETFHYHVDINSNFAANRTVSGPTLLWWLSQSQEAREAVVNAPTYPLPNVLHMLSDFITPNDRVWGNGAAFDNVILTHAYRSLNIPAPWSFRSDMCFRTIKEMFGREVEKPLFKGLRHDALSDAIYQVTHLQLIFEKMRQK